MEEKIEVGDLVECKITGFTGIATIRMEHLNRCVQFAIQPKMKKGDKEVPGKTAIDAQNLKILKKGKRKTVKKASERTGGDNYSGPLLDSF